MTEFVVPRSDIPGSASRLQFAPAEAQQLRLPLGSATVAVDLADRQGEASWVGHTLQLDLGVVLGLDPLVHDEYRVVRGDDESLIIRPAAPTSPAQKRLPPLPPLEHVADGPFFEPTEVDLAVSVSAHLQSGAYLAARIDHPLCLPEQPVPDTLHHLLRSTEAVQVLIGPRTFSRTILGLRFAVESMARHQVDRTYISVPKARLRHWHTLLAQLSVCFPSETTRGHITFVEYERLLNWRPAQGRALLIVEDGEHAAPRWANRLRTVLGRSHRALVVGDPATENLPNWPDVVLGAGATPVAFRPKDHEVTVAAYQEETSVQAWRHEFVVRTGQAWKSRAALRRHTTLPAIFGPEWDAEPVPATAASNSRWQAVVDACEARAPARIQIQVSSVKARDALRSYIRDRRTAPEVLGPTDLPPREPADVIVFADPLGVFLPRALDAPAVAVAPADTPEWQWLQFVCDVRTTARETGSSLLDVIAMMGWHEDQWLTLIAGGLRNGTGPPAEMSHHLGRAAFREAQRLQRLSSDHPPRAEHKGHDPQPIPGGLIRSHQDIVSRILSSRRHRFVHASEGGRSFLIRSPGSSADGLSAGDVIKLDRRPSESDAIPFEPGSAAADRLLGSAASRRVSMEVGIPRNITDVPLPDHATRISLVYRRVGRPRTAAVESDTLASDGSGLRAVRVGVAEHRGFPRVARPSSPNDGAVPDREHLVGLLRAVERSGGGPGVHFASIRIIAGDDFPLIEEWVRSDGPTVTMTLELPLAGAPVYRDNAGSTIRKLDICDDGHFTDATWARTCPTCHRDRCPTCVGGTELARCRLCDEPACHSCLAGDVCPDCRNPRRVPDLDTDTERAWRFRNGILYVSAGTVRVLRVGVEHAAHVLVSDDEVEDELAARRRATAFAHGLPLDAPVVFAPLALDPELEADVLWAEDRPDWEWKAVDAGETAGLVAIGEPAVLDAKEGPAVRGLTTVGLSNALVGRLREAAPPPPPRALVRQEFLERRCIALTVEGLERRVERHVAGEPVKVLARALMPLQAPVSPRYDQDGQLVGTATADNLRVDVLRINRSLLLRIHAQGRTAEWFAGAGSRTEHGAELAWHRVARGYGLAPGTVLVTDREGFSRLTEKSFATPSGARLLERSVTPHARFAAAEGRTRMVTADHLRLLDREPLPTKSRKLQRRQAEALHSVVSGLPTGATPMRRVSLAHSVAEHWVGVGDRFVTYVVPPGQPAWPPLDDIGQPSSDFEVDSAGHLLQPETGWSCESCLHQYCRACPSDSVLGPCDTCGQVACGSCREALHQATPATSTPGCERCGRFPCGDCGRTIETQLCAFCARAVCQQCIGAAVCASCNNLRATRKVSLPEDIPYRGCNIATVSERDSTIVAIRGASRSEVVVLRADKCIHWATFEDAVTKTRAAIAAGRRIGEDRRIPDIEQPAESDRADAAVWVSRESCIQVDIGGEVHKISLDSADPDEQLASLLDDGGGYPIPVPPFPGLGELLPRRSRARTLPVIVQTQETLYSVVPDGLVRATRGPDRDDERIDQAKWAPAERGSDGRDRIVARLADVQAEVLAAGRDVELRVSTPDGVTDYVVSVHAQDRAAARVAAMASWGGPCPVVTSVVLPGQVDVLRIMNGRRVKRSLRLGYQVTAPGPSADVEAAMRALTHAASGAGQAAGTVPATDAFKLLVEHFAGEPTNWIRIGIQVTDVVALDATEIFVVYEVWMEETGPVAFVKGEPTERVRIDSAGHVLPNPELCAYCARPKCTDCLVMVRRCGVCDIDACSACAGGPEPMLCPACRGLQPLSARRGKKFFRGPYPKSYARGEDVRHTVVVGRYEDGYRVIRTGAIEGTLVKGLYGAASAWLRQVCR